MVHSLQRERLQLDHPHLGRRDDAGFDYGDPRYQTRSKEYVDFLLDESTVVNCCTIVSLFRVIAFLLRARSPTSVSARRNQLPNLTLPDRLEHLPTDPPAGGHSC
jgi:hypothetical protein